MDLIEMGYIELGLSIDVSSIGGIIAFANVKECKTKNHVFGNSSLPREKI